MAHKSQQDFFLSMKEKFPQFFNSKIVLDVGSYDVNGNNRGLFDNCIYTGIDVGPGKNVDLVTTAHEHRVSDGFYEVIVSSSCLEHDQYYEKTLQAIVRMLAPGGFFFFSCAGEGYPEHGTRRTSPQDAPLLAAHGDWADYYKNLTEADVRACIDVDGVFGEYGFIFNKMPGDWNDLFFYGVKK